MICYDKLELSIEIIENRKTGFVKVDECIRGMEETTRMSMVPGAKSLVTSQHFRDKEVFTSPEIFHPSTIYPSFQTPNIETNLISGHSKVWISSVRILKQFKYQSSPDI